jgi:putative hemolysin
MIRKVLFTLFMQVGIVLSASCSPTQNAATTEPNLPNPATVFCEQNGGKLEFRQDASGGVTGICVFPDGSECDEWAYFRQGCKPGDSSLNPVPSASPMEDVLSPTIPAEAASDGWKIYHNEQFGYRFEYPADAQIILDDELRGIISVAGPMVDGESWPQFMISHPGDREDYHPPEGVDLETWLLDHELVGDERQPDVQIAGGTAIHTRHDRSPQSYAYDRYLFMKSGQLFMVVIGHTGDKEDWGLYDHFLESIQFEE